MLLKKLASTSHGNVNSAYFVKGQHLSDHLAPVIHSDPHPVVDLISTSAQDPIQRTVKQLQKPSKGIQRTRPAYIESKSQPIMST